MQIQYLQATLSDNPENRQLLLESFLYAEMGDEFGEILLEIAGAVSSEQLQRVLGDIDSIRDSTSEIARLLASNEQGEVYARGLNLAIVKRTTEILSIIPALAEGERVVAKSKYLNSTPEVDITQIEHPMAALAI